MQNVQRHDFVLIEKVVSGNFHLARPYERGDARTKNKKSLLFVYSNMKFNLTTVQSFDMKNDDYEKRAEKQL